MSRVRLRYVTEYVSYLWHTVEANSCDRTALKVIDVCRLKILMYIPVF